MIDLHFFVAHCFKRCNKCHELKLAIPEEFYRRNDRPSGLAHLCRYCGAARVRERYPRHYAKNRERLLEEERYQYAANPERKKAAARRWAEANPEKRREIRRRWKQVNPEKVNADTHRRRARKATAPGTHTATEAKQVLSAKKCHVCGKRFTNDNPATLDHVIALANGGSNNVSNLAAAHLGCNARKRTQRFNPITQQGFLL